MSKSTCAAFKGRSSVSQLARWSHAGSMEFVICAQKKKRDTDGGRLSDVWRQPCTALQLHAHSVNPLFYHARRRHAAYSASDGKSSSSSHNRRSTLLPPDGGDDDDDDDDYVNCDDVDENNEECSDYPRLNAWMLKLNTWLRAADRLLYAYGWQAQWRNLKWIFPAPLQLLTDVREKRDG